MDTIIEILKEINIAQLLSMIAVMWMGYNRLDKKMDTGFNKVNDRIDKLSDKVEAIDKRLCRIEGSLASHYFIEHRKVD